MSQKDWDLLKVYKYEVIERKVIKSHLIRNQRSFRERYWDQEPGRVVAIESTIGE